MKLFNVVRSSLLIICAVYITVASYLLATWAPVGLGYIEAHAFVAALVITTVGMWVYTTYQLWKWMTGSQLSFVEVISNMTDTVMGWDFKDNRPTSAH